MSSTSSQTTDSNVFIPQMSCCEGNNGLVKLTLLNRNDFDLHWQDILLQLDDSSPLHYPCLQLNFKCLVEGHPIPSEDSWNEAVIFNGHMDEDCSFYLMLDARLEPYTFVFTVQSSSPERVQDPTKELGPPSQEHTVDVPSFVIDIQYQQNEWIEFRADGEYQPQEAQILNVLEDDMFELEYERYGDDHQIHKETTTVHLSRLYKQSIDNHHVIRVHAPETVQDALFIKRHDELNKNTWRALNAHFHGEARKWCFEMYDEADVGVHHQAISYFVTQNVYEFLFEPQFEHKINCMVSDLDGALRLQNARQNHLRSNYDLLRDPSNAIAVETLLGIEEDENPFTCDWCCVDIGEWEHFYSCDVVRANRHDFCMNCVATVIRLNKALKSVLREVLKEELVVDVVDTIADYTLGSVIEIDCGQNARTQIAEDTETLSNANVNTNSNRNSNSNRNINSNECSPEKVLCRRGKPEPRLSGQKRKLSPSKEEAPSAKRRKLERSAHRS